MLRLLKLELGKIFKPVITTTAILTVREYEKISVNKILL